MFNIDKKHLYGIMYLYRCFFYGGNPMFFERLNNSDIECFFNKKLGQNVSGVKLDEKVVYGKKKFSMKVRSGDKFLRVKKLGLLDDMGIDVYQTYSINEESQYRYKFAEFMLEKFGVSYLSYHKDKTTEMIRELGKRLKDSDVFIKVEAIESIKELIACHEKLAKKYETLKINSSIEERVS